jgi:hypothetical protein
MIVHRERKAVSRASGGSSAGVPVVGSALGLGQASAASRLSHHHYCVATRPYYEALLPGGAGLYQLVSTGQ